MATGRRCAFVCAIFAGMCGRAALTATPEDLRDALGLDSLPTLAPRYNISPSQDVAVVRVPGKLELLSWGLVPHWAPDRKGGRSLPLSRMESVFTAPAFRDAIRQRRCLVVVTGFYEWQRMGRTTSTPFLIARPDRKPFALAGLWERWLSKEGEVVESCAVLTQPASPPLDVVHHRMPIVLPNDAWRSWLDPARTEVAALLEPRGLDLVAIAVGLHVNNPRHDDRECQTPREPAQGRLFAPS
jgi:putative SOS response-associated peptidase YedK